MKINVSEEVMLGKIVVDPKFTEMAVNEFNIQIEDVTKQITEHMRTFVKNDEEFAHVLIELKNYYIYRQHTETHVKYLENVAANFVRELDPNKTYSILSTLTTCFDVNAILRSSPTKK